MGNEKINLDKVSPAVKQFAEAVKKRDSDGGKTITDLEYEQLQDYLRGNETSLNPTEKEFINGFMIEYTSAKEAEQVTPATNKFVKNVKAHVKDKEKINTYSEAMDLVRYLDTPDLKPADKEFVKKVLVESGYGNLLNDRVGALEQRVADNEAKDAAQDQAIGDVQKVNAEQNALIEGLETKVKNGESIVEDVIKLVKQGKIADAKLKKAIEANEQAIKANGDADAYRILTENIHEWWQNYKIGRLADRVSGDD